MSRMLPLAAVLAAGLPLFFAPILRADAPAAKDAAPPSQTDILQRMLKEKSPPATPVVKSKEARASSASTLELAELLRAPAATLGELEKEGSLVSQVRAHLVWVGGEKNIPVLVFHSETKDTPRRPMIVLETRKLEELETLQADAGRDASFVISGVVETYRGNNYIRLQRVAVLHPDGNLE